MKRCEVQGFEDFNAAIAELSMSTATAKNIVKRALIVAAAPMVTAAKGAAPRKSGVMADSIDASPRLAGKQAAGAAEYSEVLRKGGSKAKAQVVLIVARAATKDDSEPAIYKVQIFVGPGPLPYPSLVEFGHGTTPPHPFMRPAFDGTKAQVFDNLKVALADQLDKAAQRAARKQARLIAAAQKVPA